MDLLVEIVSPDGTVFRGEAHRFRAPGVEGAFEVLRGHAPMLAAVGVGTAYITLADGRRVAYAVSGGFVEVLDDRVILLAETAEPAAEIDLDRAREAEQSALARLEASQSPEERRAAQERLEKQRNRLRAAMAGA